MYQEFQTTVWDYYHDHQRELPWRQLNGTGTLNPYHVMVSEIMLQQTQVPRVIQKYQEFLTAFPTIESLAQASLQDVFVLWQGLGYNRRARFLREAAVMVVNEYDGTMPQTVPELTKLPGIGVNTASAIAVYSYNQPLVFIETNIRTVYLHHFFPDMEGVSDADILQMVTATVDIEHPREWYWALMDYGTYLKKEFGNANIRSKHYKKQSAFIGSKRQIRGQVLRLLADHPYSIAELTQEITDERLNSVINDLLQENLIILTAEKYAIAP